MIAALPNTDHYVSKAVISGIITIDYLTDSVIESNSFFFQAYYGEAFLFSHLQ